MHVRTMFFEKPNEENKVRIDGNIYEVSNGSNNDMSNCSSKIVDVYNYIVEQYDMREASNYNSWKKDFVKHLKEWDKCYVKHAKSTWPEMNSIHMTCMKPMTQLIDSNLNFQKLETMIKNHEETPEFRYKALEKEFV